MPACLDSLSFFLRLYFSAFAEVHLPVHLRFRFFSSSKQCPVHNLRDTVVIVSTLRGRVCVCVCVCDDSHHGASLHSREAVPNLHLSEHGTELDKYAILASKTHSKLSVVHADVTMATASTPCKHAMCLATGHQYTPSASQRLVKSSHQAAEMNETI